MPLNVEGMAMNNKQRIIWIYIICNINSETADEPAESSFSSYSVRDYI